MCECSQTSLSITSIDFWKNFPFIGIFSCRYGPLMHNGALVWLLGNLSILSVHALQEAPNPLHSTPSYSQVSCINAGCIPPSQRGAQALVLLLAALTQMLLMKSVLPISWQQSDSILEMWRSLRRTEVIRTSRSCTSWGVFTFRRKNTLPVVWNTRVAFWRNFIWEKARRGISC